MRTINLLSICAVLIIGLTAHAQTNDVPSPAQMDMTTKLAPAVGFFKSWFVDNTNFFGQKNAIFGVDGAYSNGHDTKENTADKKTFGAVATLSFPIDDKGQASVGLWLAYFDHKAAYGSLQTTLGKTLTVPSWFPLLGGQQAFVFNEGGPGFRFDGSGQMFAQDFQGIVWKHEFAKSWTLYLNAARGTATCWSSDIYLAGVNVGHQF